MDSLPLRSEMLSTLDLALASDRNLFDGRGMCAQEVA